MHHDNSLKKTIYVYLMNEGTDCWRPVESVQIGDNRYLISEDEVPPEDEQWEFLPGETVCCKQRVFASGTTALVAFKRCS